MERMKSQSQNNKTSKEKVNSFFLRPFLCLCLEISSSLFLKLFLYLLLCIFIWKLMVKAVLFFKAIWRK